jgi:predicted metal-dependent hydrolase
VTVIRSVSTSSGTLDFTLRRTRRRTLAIHVHPDGALEVVAPEGAAEDAVDARVAARAAWIRRQQAFFEDLRPRTPPRRHVPGETHLHLGRRYRLRVEDGSESVRLSGGWLHVSVPGRVPDRVAAALSRWRRARATERIAARLAEVTERLRIPAARRPRLVLRTMRTRWASLSQAGILSVNPDLIRAPLTCIDYVLVHELCHLDEPHHGPGFWRLLSRRMPDWEAHKRRLEKTLA